MNDKYTNTKIYTTIPSKIIFKTDTIKTVKNKVQLNVERSNQPITITLFTDSLSKTILLKPKNSFAFYSNILYNCGIGILVDNNNMKKFTYPQRIYVNSFDTISKYFSYEQINNKGQIHLHLSLPYINSFFLLPDYEKTKQNTGFLGLCVGLDYYHSKNQYVNFSTCFVTDFFVPFPAPVHFEGIKESMYSSYLSLSNNHKIKRMSIGYGVSYSKNTWNLQQFSGIDTLSPIIEPVKKSNNAFGFIFSMYYQTGEHINIGVVYKPSFLRLDSPNKFEYEHLISVDLAWKILLKK
ncbi:MAG: hypothetical protein ACOYMA_08480 [Bacteroidia bacterium]